MVSEWCHCSTGVPVDFHHSKMKVNKSKMSLFGRVVGILRQVGRCIYLVSDGTGPPMQVH